MSSSWTRDQVAHLITHDLLLDRLQLASSGLTDADIQGDTPLVGDGLALDSVDALDLLVSVEKSFGIKTPDPDRAFIERTCKTLNSLVEFVMQSLDRQAALAAESAPHAG